MQDGDPVSECTPSRESPCPDDHDDSLPDDLDRSYYTQSRSTSVADDMTPGKTA